MMGHRSRANETVKTQIDAHTCGKMMAVKVKRVETVDTDTQSG